MFIEQVSVFSWLISSPYFFNTFLQILSRGGHINDRDGLTDMTLLHYAAKAGARGVGDPDEACRMVCNTLASLSSG